MLSFKDWKDKQSILKESALAGVFTLGVKSPNNIGISGANTEPISDINFELEEAKKKSAKKCKKMDGELSDEDAETAPDGEVIPKEKAAPKDLDAEEEGGEDEIKAADDEAEAADDEEEAADDEAEAADDEEEAADDELAADAKKKLPVPMFQKKKQKKQMKKEGIELSDDDKEFLASLKKMYDAGNPNHKFSSGLSEDALMTPVDPNAGLADMEPEINPNPQPGEVGYAPATKIAH